MKLKAKEMCPIHRRRDCCGRAEFNRYAQPKHGKWETVRTGVRRIADKNSDFGDGFRYKFSPAETRKFTMQKISEQGGLCGICHKPLTDMTDVVPDHRLPRGMNASRRDDRFIQAAHSKCNLEKGSKRI